MRRIKFLVKLVSEGRLESVEPSEKISISYLRKSESNLASAKILLENGHPEESVSLAYYSMYNALAALLFRTGIKCENHSASILLLKEVFRIDNSDISFAKKERIDKQYYVDFHATEEDVKNLIGKAEEFGGKLFDFISRLNNEDIMKFRQRFRKLTE